MNLSENNYQLASNAVWTGRSVSPDLENQYWYQDIELCDLRTKIDHNINVGLLGYACDEGVRRNLGRVGARLGPDKLRKQLAKLPIHYQQKTIGDFGNIVCFQQDMEQCQKDFSNGISELLKHHIFPIGIGGGHDIAYAHFMGLREALKETSKTIGIINFDAHFDLRPIENQGNSGTPFYQIIQDLKNSEEMLHYFPIGIQQQSNTKSLFDIAQENKVNFLYSDECDSDSEQLKRELNAFISKVDYIYITIDMDGFSSEYAPGVSAPSSLGFTPQFVYKMLQFLLNTKKVISCDIAELNPEYDQDNRTTKLAAKLVDFIVQNIIVDDTTIFTS